MLWCYNQLNSNITLSYILQVIATRTRGVRTSSCQIVKFLYDDLMDMCVDLIPLIDYMDIWYYKIHIIQLCIYIIYVKYQQPTTVYVITFLLVMIISMMNC